MESCQTFYIVHSYIKDFPLGSYPKINVRSIQIEVKVSQLRTAEGKSLIMQRPTRFAIFVYNDY